MATEAPVSQVPDWVKAEIFTDVLKESVAGFSKIKSFKATGGSAAGENYATIMLRVNIEVELIDGKEKSVSYMLKLPHQSEMFQAMMKINNIFEAERAAYNTIVPEMEQLYRDAGVEVKFGAKSYDLKDAKTDYVLLEDLAPQGFKNMNRLEGLDQAHTESALRKLSQWHAASVARVAQIGPYPEKYNTGFFTEQNRPIVTEMNASMAKGFLESFATYEDNEEYVNIVKSLQPKLTDIYYKLAKPDTSGLNVLNHGDFWSNNMMFSHDSSGKIEETYLVDFQMPKYGSVAHDLLYFLISSTKFEDKLTKFDYYIKFYHENLVESLKILKYSKPLPTLREIHIALIKNGFWGYFTATGVMGAVLVDPTENASLDNFLSDTKEGVNFKSLLYTNPRYRKHMKIILPWLLNRGVFEEC
ncbi:uncharacterized protein LOC133837156 [Drosophila sulfurigaster albostrigata]|uniref:uncharacterized protein LOC133837156 n=1 Tax=Drosophila sulfurigaster albostrigata TaxID=89887 RepID=UPI002D21BC2C|nr:uncharacterized protein LOC133837156 [Drosophila sulfurigaster albostrigata]